MKASVRGIGGGVNVGGGMSMGGGVIISKV